MGGWVGGKAVKGPREGHGISTCGLYSHTMGRVILASCLAGLPDLAVTFSWERIARLDARLRMDGCPFVLLVILSCCCCFSPHGRCDLSSHLPKHTCLPAVARCG